MSNEYHRLLKQQEALMKMLKPFEDAKRYVDPIKDAYERLGINSTVRKVLEEESQRKKLLELGSFKALESAAQTVARESGLQKGISEQILRDLKNIGYMDSTGDIYKSITESVKAQTAYEQLFRLPAPSELGLIAHEARADSALALHVQFSEDRLQSAMARMHAPWMQLDAGARSAQAMTDIFAIGKGLNSLPPFDQGFTNALRLDLGDWRDEFAATDEYLIDPILRSNAYVERGFNQELTNFTSSAFDEGLNIAGLLETEPASDVDTEDEDEVARARIAFEELRRFELALRRFIEEAMQETFGNDWMKRQLPQKMLDGWIAKKEKAVKAGEVEQRLIDYADFSDYKPIIEKRDNWDQVFKHVFKRPEDVRESFQRLFPVRIATMHARLVTKDDHLLLLVETRRVLKAINAKK